MVHGIDKFREYFRDFTGRYVLIGGAACDILLNRANADFRATKDLDVVLIMEAIDRTFVERVIDFVEIGGYQHVNRCSGKEQYYRFQNPADKSFPAMIELFTRKPDFLHTINTRLAPIHISDDVISLSAILLNDDYYSLIRSGRTEVDNISVLQTEYIILFKMKAWLDLSARKRKGESIDSKNIKKHKNDVLRLAAVIDPETRLIIDGQIKNDVQQYITEAENDLTDLKTLGIPGVSYQDLINRLKSCYGL